MKKTVIEALHLEPRSEGQLHATIDRFEAKWQRKQAERFDMRF